MWVDADGDGVQDPGEPGLGGVTVNLYAESIVVIDGVTYNAGDLVATTTTDGTGNYSFDGLPAGAYSVEVDESTLAADFTATYDPDGVFTAKWEGERPTQPRYVTDAADWPL